MKISQLMTKDVTTCFLSLTVAIGMGCSHTNTGATQPPPSSMAGASGPTASETDKQRREQMDPARSLLRAAHDLQLGPDQTAKLLGLEQQLESNEKETMA